MELNGLLLIKMVFAGGKKAVQRHCRQVLRLILMSGLRMVQQSNHSFQGRKIKTGLIIHIRQGAYAMIHGQCTITETWTYIHLYHLQQMCLMTGMTS